MHIHQRVVRIIFLNVWKGFDLIDHDILLENMRTICIRQSLVEIMVSDVPKNK